MKKSLFLSLITASALSAHGTEVWNDLSYLIPELNTETTTIQRITYTSGGNLIANGGPSADAVQATLGALDAGWYSGNRTGDTGSVASVMSDGSTQLFSASANGGGFTAVKFNELTTGEASKYGELKISFETGGLSNNTRTGQSQNFSLWYSLGGGEETSLFQVGSTFSGSAGEVANKTWEWTISKDSYNNLFEQGATFYLVLNTGAIDNTYAFQQLEVKNFQMEGLVIPEPSSCFFSLLGTGVWIFRRKKR